MSRKVCPTCRADATRTTLQRCTVPSCPLQKQRVADAAASVRVAALTVVGAALLIALLAAVGWRMSQSPSERAANPGVAGIVPPPVRRWVGSLGGGEAPPPPPPPAREAVAARVQSFDCSGALSAGRALICTDPDLATADYNLGLAYRSALVRARKPDVEQRRQRAWLAEIDRLGADADRLAAHYRERLTALEAR